MLPFDGPRWETLEGGYRMPFDPRPLLRQLESGDDDEAIWSGLWQNLHHQGHVGVASYAAVPYLVKIQRNRTSAGWNTYALITLIELMRTEPRNPELPTWLEQDYFAAIAEMAKRGLADLPQVEDREILRSILAIVALWKGTRVYARVLLNFSEEEVSELTKT
jgi:hypothetical protein